MFSASLLLADLHRLALGQIVHRGAEVLHHEADGPQSAVVAGHGGGAQVVDGLLHSVHRHVGAADLQGDHPLVLLR